MGWIFVNILLPLLLPLIGVLLIQLVTPAAVQERSEGNYELMVLVKDGQLGWAAAGMCAAAFYDFSEALQLLGDNYRQVPSHWMGIMVPLVFSTVGAMFVAASGAVHTTELLKKPIGSIGGWIKHYALFVFSLFVTASSAIVLITVHFGMMPRGIVYIASAQ